MIGVQRLDCLNYMYCKILKSPGSGYADCSFLGSKT